MRENKFQTIISSQIIFYQNSRGVGNSSNIFQPPPHLNNQPPKKCQTIIFLSFYLGKPSKLICCKTWEISPTRGEGVRNCIGQFPSCGWEIQTGGEGVEFKEIIPNLEIKFLWIKNVSITHIFFLRFMTFERKCCLWNFLSAVVGEGNFGKSIFYIIKFERSHF